MTVQVPVQPRFPPPRHTRVFRARNGQPLVGGVLSVLLGQENYKRMVKSASSAEEVDQYLARRVKNNSPSRRVHAERVLVS